MCLISAHRLASLFSELRTNERPCFKWQGGQCPQMSALHAFVHKCLRTRMHTRTHTYTQTNHRLESVQVSANLCLQGMQVQLLKGGTVAGKAGHSLEMGKVKVRGWVGWTAKAFYTKEVAEKQHAGWTILQGKLIGVRQVQIWGEGRLLHSLLGSNAIRCMHYVN